jgi:glyoxalase superfamily protein
MTTPWSLTIDCARPSLVAAFWAFALGYVEPPPPNGFTTWEDWFRHHDVPESEWDDGAYLVDPEGVRPRLSFMRVPESKAAKNRLHLDVQAGGGRETPWDVRWPRVLAAVERLTEAGATVVREHESGGKPDHIEMRDPEGNEFCVL